MSFIKTDKRHLIIVEKIISNQIKQDVNDIGIKISNTKCKTYTYQSNKITA